MTVCMSETERRRKKTSVVSELRVSERLCLCWVCACVYKGGGCRQTGSRGLQNRTGHHNSSGRSLATDRQAGFECWWLTDRNLPPTTDKEHLSAGETRPYSHTHSNKHKHSLIHTHTLFIFDSSLSSTLSSWLALSFLRLIIFLTCWLQGKKKKLTQFYFL